MAAAPHTVDFSKDLEIYLDLSAAYIVAKETVKDKHQETNGEHFHVAAEMSDKQYDSYRNTILKKKYQLRGKACNGLPRQYGVVKNVRDETKFLGYTVKHKNIEYRNISLDEIKQHISNSYVKEEKRTYQEDLMAYLVQNVNQTLYLGIRRPPTHDYFIPQSTDEEEEEEEEQYTINVSKIQLDILTYHMEHAVKALSRSQIVYYTNLFLQFHFPPRQEFMDQILRILIHGNSF